VALPHVACPPDELIKVGMGFGLVAQTVPLRQWEVVFTILGVSGRPTGSSVSRWGRGDPGRQWREVTTLFVLAGSDLIRSVDCRLQGMGDVATGENRADLRDNGDVLTPLTS
jgi:hypothetical protein